MYDSYNFVTIKVRENKGQEINENNLQYTLMQMEMELRYMGQLMTFLSLLLLLGTSDKFPHIFLRTIHLDLKHKQHAWYVMSFISVLFCPISISNQSKWQI